MIMAFQKVQESHIFLSSSRRPLQFLKEFILFSLALNEEIRFLYIRFRFLDVT